MKLLRQHRRIRLTLIAALLLQAITLAMCLTPRADGARVVMDDVLGVLVMCAPGAESGLSAAPATDDDPAPHKGSACWHCTLVAAFVMAIALTAGLLQLLGLPDQRAPWRAALGAWLMPARLGGLGGRAPPLAA